MTQQTGLFTAALRQVRASVLLLLVGGNLLLLGAAIMALWIPDSHGWQLVLSFLLALGLASGLLLWNATAMRRMRAPAAACPLWQGALFLGAWLLLAALLFHVAALAEPNVETRAGYWNSQLSSSLRRLLPYARLVTLQEVAIAAFRWVVIPGAFLPFAMETATFGLQKGWFRRAWRVFISARHWVVAIVALGLSAWLIPVLVTWHPTHKVVGEVISAVIRLGIAGLLGLSAAVLLLAVDAALLRSQSPLAPNDSAS